MINEEKLRLMTKTALLKKNNREAFNINRYYKKDFVGYHVLLLWIFVTMAFVMVSGGVGVVYIEQYPEAAQKLDWWYVFFVLLMAYIIVLVIYVIIAMFVYSMRYDHAQMVMKKYTVCLKQLDKEYQAEEQQTAAADAAKKQQDESTAKKKNAVKRKGGSKE